MRSKLRQIWAQVMGVFWPVSALTMLGLGALLVLVIELLIIFF